MLGRLACFLGIGTGWFLEMKKEYIKDILKRKNKDVVLYGWIKSKRVSKEIVFLDVVDSSGQMQAVVDKKNVSSWNLANQIAPESSVLIKGVLKRGKNNLEVGVKTIQLVGDAKLNLSPRPRQDFDIFGSSYADYVLKNRHLFLRNPKLQAVLKFKHKFLINLHKWFTEREFLFLDAPVLTELLLYDDDSAFKLDYSDKISGKQEVFLSQCNTFQLEAAIHSFEKVYNMTPSFRAEHSKSSRHLREYWHLKVEIAWANLDDLIKIAGEMLYAVAKNTVEECGNELEVLGVKVDLDKLKPPYKQITYDEALKIIHSKGNKMKWGKSFGVEEEMILTKEFGENFLFIRGIPCSAEGFPFSRDKSNIKITRTCDLIAPEGFGELLGTAEKITDKKELLERMKEKGKTTPEQMKRYQWYVDLRDYGIIPHGGIGMGIERVVRYLLKIPHVRDTISFPRLYGRYPNP